MVLTSKKLLSGQVFIGGFLDNICVYLPKNATVVEALPTAYSGTNDPSGFIHAIFEEEPQ